MKNNVVLLGLLLLFGSSTAAEEVAFHVLDVGYGAAVHLEVEYRHILFDTGPKVARAKVMDHLSRHFVTHLHAIFLTHTHPDHAGNLLSITSQITTDQVYWNEQLPPEEDLVVELDQVEAKLPFHLLKPGENIQLTRNLSVHVLRSSYETNDLNDNSLVYEIEYGRNRILLPGDIGPARQKNLAALEAPRLKKTKFLLWPHHGGALAPEFLTALSKVDYCVVSVGRDPEYTAEAVPADQSDTLCKKFFRTEDTGTLSFVLGRKIYLLQQ